MNKPGSTFPRHAHIVWFSFCYVVLRLLTIDMGGPRKFRQERSCPVDAVFVYSVINVDLFHKEPYKIEI